MFDHVVSILVMDFDTPFASTPWTDRPMACALERPDQTPTCRPRRPSNCCRWPIDCCTKRYPPRYDPPPGLDALTRGRSGCTLHVKHTMQPYHQVRQAHRCNLRLAILYPAGRSTSPIWPHSRSDCATSNITDPFSATTFKGQRQDYRV